MSATTDINFASIILHIINCVAEHGKENGVKIANDYLKGKYSNIQIERAFNILGYSKYLYT